MIVLILAILGGLTGFFLAKKRGGDRNDKLQFTAIFAMVGAVIGVFATIFIHNALV